MKEMVAFLFLCSDFYHVASFFFFFSGRLTSAPQQYWPNEIGVSTPV
jgi:hypothetical protein